MDAGDVGAKGTDRGNRHRCRLTYTRRVTYYRTALSGETKVVMEYTGAYYEPIANALHNQSYPTKGTTLFIIYLHSKIKTNRQA